ncbi:hypothetical protein AtNW77_Chr2g0244601 [Arabidopsis thaliana]|uniref:Uncharacterized protein n=2 Tax=Arabidopsis thaliana TaxID=3702 RepID=Q1G355_ARATH|nr:uncharacterized protein AT2G25409 [Arabidopsis thaliana]ABF59289.1 unknown protein [Arabidopsis thaliana]AEC07699.1 hypothetical protein AT2G25409 [Arabidopsis thaliana]|eukprot:NP_001118383.1 hypothetical protein AT2G25409 [Arabidopsis thaliana]
MERSKFQITYKRYKTIQSNQSRKGDGLLRQTGQELCNLSHASIHSVWKQCSHSGKHLTVSLVAYSDKQMGQTTSFDPVGSLLLSPSSTFLYDSIVDSSRPILATSLLGCDVTDPERRATTACCICEETLSELHMTRPTQKVKAVSGPTRERHIIFSTCKPVL